MEQTIDSGCVLLKLKEFEDLKKRAENNNPKEISVSWQCYGGSSRIGGNLYLSPKLKNQIFDIVKRIQEKCNKDRLKFDKTVELDTKYAMIHQFKNLSWYKRLFFKDSYIK